MKKDFFQHPAALVETKTIGRGTRIWAFAHLLEGARVGRDCNLGDHTFIEGGVTLGDRVTLKNGVAVWNGVKLDDDVFVGPNAVFTNDLLPRSPRFAGAKVRYERCEDWLVPTRVERGASIGANATIKAGVTIGKFAMIGAGTVVTRDVPAHALLTGVPGRIRGWVCECGDRVNVDSPGTVRCQRCGLKFRLQKGKLSFRACEM